MNLFLLNLFDVNFSTFSNILFFSDLESSPFRIVLPRYSGTEATNQIKPVIKIETISVFNIKEELKKELTF